MHNFILPSSYVAQQIKAYSIVEFTLSHTSIPKIMGLKSSDTVSPSHPLSKPRTIPRDKLATSQALEAALS